MSPAAFAAAIREKLDALQQSVQALDPSAKVLAYLDDVYVVVASEHVAEALRLSQEFLGSTGLELNMTLMFGLQTAPQHFRQRFHELR